MSDVTLQTPAAAPAPEPRKSPWAMFFSVLTEPRATFEALRARPAWWQPLLVFWLVAVGAGLAALPKSLELGVQQALAKAPGTDPEVLRRTIAVVSYVTVPLSALVAVAVGTLILAGILAIIGTMAGGNGSFLQVWSATLFASVPVSIVASIIKALMILMTPASALQTVSTSLALVLPKESVGTGLYYFLSLLDPFSIWSVVLLTIGYAVVMEFPLQKSAYINVPLWLVRQGITLGMVALGLSQLK